MRLESLLLSEILSLSRAGCVYPQCAFWVFVGLSMAASSPTRPVTVDEAPNATDTA